MRWTGLFCLLVLPLTAAPLRFESGAQRVHLLELYTSEGCSSCPPAEDWLGKLRAAPGLWRDFVPLAFHVAYWDRLGWKDRFASRQFTDRQYAYATAWRSESVYTPGFALDGAEWRWGGQAGVPGKSADPAGRLSIELEPDGRCRVNFAGADGREVHVALLGGGIVSEVKAGENRGRKLAHDFVVLELQSAPVRNGTAEVRLTMRPDPTVPRRALAAWVTGADEVTPLQATGGWLD